MSAAADRAAAGQADPELRALVTRRDALEERISALKATKDSSDPAKYEQELEQLLIDLSRVSRAIREKQK
jgi:hypothetical protein